MNNKEGSLILDIFKMKEKDFSSDLKLKAVELDIDLKLFTNIAEKLGKIDFKDKI